MCPPTKTAGRRAPSNRDPLPRTRPGARRVRSLVAMATTFGGFLFFVSACAAGPDGGSIHIEAVNLLDHQQSSLEASPTEIPGPGWETQGNAVLERSTTVSTDGEASLRVEGSEYDPVHTDDSGTIRIATSTATSGVRVHPGTVYAGWLDVMSRSGASPVRCELRWYDRDGAILRTDEGREVTERPSRWRTPICLGRAPTGASYAALRLHVANSGPGDVHYVDNAWLIAASPEPTDQTAGVSTTVPQKSVAPPTTQPSTTQPPAPQPSTTQAPESSAPPSSEMPGVAPVASGVRPTSSNTGPTVSSPKKIGKVEVFAGQDVTISDVITDQIVVHGGGKLTATNVRVNSSVVVLPESGVAKTKLHLDNALVTNGLTINTIDGSGNLHWGPAVPVDIKVSNSWIRHPQGSGTDHTEALAAFGYTSGAMFINDTFIQDGPFNGTATATINWHGDNTTFDGCYFGWNGQTAAWFTVYVEGTNNVVRNSHLEAARAGYIYPDSTPPATYNNNTDPQTGNPVTR